MFISFSFARLMTIREVYVTTKHAQKTKLSLRRRHLLGARRRASVGAEGSWKFSTWHVRRTNRRTWPCLATSRGLDIDDGLHWCCFYLSRKLWRPDMLTTRKQCFSHIFGEQDAPVYECFLHDVIVHVKKPQWTVVSNEDVRRRKRHALQKESLERVDGFFAARLSAMV